MTAPLPREAGHDDLPSRLLTLDEYLAFEEENPVRHEFVGGRVFAMAPGVARPHGRIGMNIANRLANAAGDGPCRVYQSDVKALIDDIVYYPDVMVACGPEPENPYYEDAPCFIAEVLSPSTRTIDLREKAPNYRKLPSLQLLLIINQSARRVDRFWRDAAGVWLLEVIIGQGEIPVPCPVPADGPLVLTLDEIYRGVTLLPVPGRVREGEPEYALDEAGAVGV